MVHDRFCIELMVSAIESIYDEGAGVVRPSEVAAVALDGKLELGRWCGLAECRGVHVRPECRSRGVCGPPRIPGQARTEQKRVDEGGPRRVRMAQLKLYHAGPECHSALLHTEAHGPRKGRVGA